jgi:hypothetical protein
MAIHYKIHLVKPNIFLVVVPNEYDRSMLFLRVQEYSESPNPKIRGQSFDILDFIEWYTHKNKGSFTYAEDWNGFNLAHKTAMECYQKLPREYVNKYDRVFMKILTEINKSLASVSRADAQNAYIIGADSTNSVTAHHEVYHAYYFTDANYRKYANAMLKEHVPSNIYNKIRRNLMAIGYLDNPFTIQNEMHAYLRGKDWSHPDILVGINKGTLRRIHKNFAKAMKKYPN